MAIEEFFVATNGNDSWTGTRPTPNSGGTDGPFASLEAARDAMRASGTVKRCYVRGGSYRRTGTLALTNLDDGTAYYAFPGEFPVFFGSAFAPTLTAIGGGQYGIPLAAPPGLDVFCSGARMNPACFFTLNPSDYTVGWGWARQDGTTSVVYTSSVEVPASGSLTGVWCQAFDVQRLSDGLAAVSNITDSGGLKAIQLSTAIQYLVKKGGTFRLFGRSDWIANTNEFGWDQTNSRLVVKPVDPNSFQIALPVVNEFITATSVTNLIIRGLDFRENTREYPAIRFTTCTNPKVQDCWFYRVGEATRFSGCTTALVERCSINDTVANGVYADTHTNGLIVRGNTLANIGTHTVARKNGVGIGGNGMDNCVIKWNSVSSCSRYGISIKDWNADNANTNNLIQMNAISDVLKHGADGAGIETLGRSNNQTNTSILDNSVAGVYGIASNWNTGTDLPEWLPNHKAWGIYLDDKTNDVLVQGNIVRGAGWGSYFVHGGDNNEFYNNIGILDFASAVLIRIEWLGSSGQPTGEPANNTFQRNIGYRVGLSGTPNYWTLFTPGTYTMGSNLVYGVTAKDGTDTVADPVFVDATNHNYRFDTGSPAPGLTITQLLFDDMGTQGYPTSTYYTAPPAPAYIEPVVGTAAHTFRVLSSGQADTQPDPTQQQPPPPPPVIYAYFTGPGVFEMGDIVSERKPKSQ